MLNLAFIYLTKYKTLYYYRTSTDTTYGPYESMASLFVYIYESNIINHKHLQDILIEYWNISKNKMDHCPQNLGILGLRDKV